MSLLIKGGDVVDGSGSAPKRSDVLLVSGRIAAIGNLASYKADRTISANGCFVVPGFIDMASGTDRRLSVLTDKGSKELLLQGITTAICGTGGVSLAPLMYGSLESLAPWSKWESLNINWHSVADLMSLLGDSRLGVNFASFSGYDTVKKSISKKKRGLSRSEAQVMTHILSASALDGSLGVSLSDEDSASADMSVDEARAFGAMLVSAKSILSADLPQSMKKPSEAIESIIKWTKMGVPTIVHKFLRAAVSSKELSKSLDALESATVSARVTASACPIGIDEMSLRSAIPESAWSEDPKELSENLLKKRNAAAMEKLWPRERLAKLWVADAPKAEFLIGKNVAEFAGNREIESAECFAKITEISSGRISFYIEIERDRVFEDMIAHPRVTIESGAYGSMEQKSEFHKKLTGAFPAFIDAMNRSGVNIEKAIAKTSALPAMACNLGKRGMLSEGFSADIVILKDRRPNWVFVNGIESVSDGALTGERGGKTIKRNV